MRYKIYIICILCLPNIIYAASHHPLQFLEQISGAPNEGEQLVQHYCLTCHADKPQIPVGAPRISQGSYWQIRLKKGFAQVYKNVEDGMPPMPPRGGCFECSDRQLKLAIVTLLDKISIPKS